MDFSAFGKILKILKVYVNSGRKYLKRFVVIVSLNSGGFIMSLIESLYNAMKIYVYILERLNLKRFAILKNC